MAQKRTFTGRIGRTIMDTQWDFRVEESPSKGKPNVIYIVLDDLGFSHLGCYGSTIHTPNLDQLAKDGLRYNNFHTTAICSATRASLLTGANHHSVGVDNLVEFVTGCQNGQGGINPSYATLAEVLKEYDYRTFAVGKWHLNTTFVRTQAGPFHNWPLGKGFDNYYGFLAADSDQWNPTLTRDNTLVPQPKKASEGYHLSEDLTEEAIKYIYSQHLSYPEQPFFLYLAYGAMHCPHHAPKEYIEKYRGKFDQGWDAIREEWFANQKKLGIIPEDAQLTDRNEYVEAWEDLSEEQKKAYARFMEVFAGFLEHTDAQIGRLIDYLKAAGIYEDTMIVFLSDNGASAEGGRDGHYNLNTSMDITEDYPRDVERVLEHFDTLGDEYSFPHYPTGWANAGNTPFQWYKIWTHEGGVRDPFIISYPKGIKDKGGIRSQFVHVNDVTPTVLDVLGFEKPSIIKGVPQEPYEGISFTNTFENADAKARRTVQHFEIYGNRSIYKDGWKAVVNHMMNHSYEEDQWELYHVEEDFSEKYNVADQYPEKLRELQDEWLIQAARYHVFPMPLNGFNKNRDQKMNSFKHLVVAPKRSVFEYVLYPYDLIEDPGVDNRNHTITFTLKREDVTEEGVLLAQGDRFGGISIYIKDNRIHYVYNADNDKYFRADAVQELPVGEIEIKVSFVEIGKEQAEVTLFVNGEKAAETKVTQFHYLTNGGVSLKINHNTSVDDLAYEAPFVYNGLIQKVDIDVPARVVVPAEELRKQMHVE